MKGFFRGGFVCDGHFYFERSLENGVVFFPMEGVACQAEAIPVIFAANPRPDVGGGLPYGQHGMVEIFRQVGWFQLHLPCHVHVLRSNGFGRAVHNGHIVIVGHGLGVVGGMDNSHVVEIFL